MEMWMQFNDNLTIFNLVLVLVVMYNKARTSSIAILHIQMVIMCQIPTSQSTFTV